MDDGEFTVPPEVDGDANNPLKQRVGLAHSLVKEDRPLQGWIFESSAANIERRGLGQGEFSLESLTLGTWYTTKARSDQGVCCQAEGVTQEALRVKKKEKPPNRQLYREVVYLRRPTKKCVYFVIPRDLYSSRAYSKLFFILFMLLFSFGSFAVHGLDHGFPFQRFLLGHVTLDIGANLITKLAFQGHLLWQGQGFNLL